MSNYNKSTNFAVKDTLTSGDPDKVVSGVEIDNEFNSIASAVTSKADKVVSSTANNVPTLTSSGNIQDSGESITTIGSPVGSITMIATSTVPSGWLECDGSEISRTTFSNLFSAIGLTFGSGDNATTFNLPDLRGEFVRGWDNGRGVDSGRNFGSSQSDEFKSHSHSYNAGDDQSPDSGGPHIITDDTSKNITYSGQINNAGGVETRPRNIALMYIIKT